MVPLGGSISKRAVDVFVSSEDSVEDDIEVGDGVLFILQEGEDGMSKDTKDTVAGGSLDTGTTAPVGRINDIAKDASTGSGNGTEIIESEGINIDRS